MPNYLSKFVLNGVEYLIKAAASVTGVKGDNESSYRSGDVNITKDNIGLGNVGNYKAVSTAASQGLSDTEKSNARANIGAGTSSFSGSYNDLSNKPTIPTKVSELTNDSGYTTNTGTVTQVKVGTTAYNPSSGVISLPAYPTDTNTHRPIQVNGTEILGNNTSALNLKAGSNVSVTNSSGTVTIAATDTNTDTKVTQSETTTANWRKVALGAQNDSSSGTAVTSKTDQVYVSPSIEVQPSTGTLKATALSATTLNGVTIGSSPKFTDSDTKNTAGSTDTSSKIFLIGATSQAANPQTYSHDTAYVGTDGCLYSGGSKVLTAHDGNNRKAFYGTCATAAATKDKVVTLSESAGWPGLVAGVIVGVKFSNTNTYSNATSSPITLNVNSTGAKNIWYGSNHSGGGNTGANTTVYGRAGYINYYMYDGTYWVWMSSSADNNTTYSVATQSANGLLSSTDKKKLDTLSSVPTGQYHLTFGKTTS